jgi:hypothetical protein
MHRKKAFRYLNSDTGLLRHDCGDQRGHGGIPGHHSLQKARTKKGRPSSGTTVQPVVVDALPHISTKGVKWSIRHDNNSGETVGTSTDPLSYLASSAFESEKKTKLRFLTRAFDRLSESPGNWLSAKRDQGKRHTTMEAKAPRRGQNATAPEKPK